MKKFILFATVLFSMGAATAQKIFTPADEGSKVHFVIKNLGINTGGDIAGLKGTIKFDAKKPASSSFDVTAAVSTIDTDNDRRDGHLKNADFFDAEKFPTIHIVSTSITQGADLKHFIFKGTLTIKDVAKPVEFTFTAEGLNGGALFTSDEFEINRLDFPVGKESATMSDKVTITLKVFAK
jgi:polyisoprenoid-binding protein YceI